MNRINIRVYGLLINSNQQVLVSDENRYGIQFTKFPGGGLEWGEGVLDALKREFLEELNISIEVEGLFYLTDFFQVSAFNKDEQIISVYYFVSYPNWREIITQPKPVEFNGGQEVHRWMSISEIDIQLFKFPIDKIVASQLKFSFSPSAKNN